MSNLIADEMCQPPNAATSSAISGSGKLTAGRSACLVGSVELYVDAYGMTSIVM
jgi:hypothetical protein